MSFFRLMRSPYIDWTEMNLQELLDEQARVSNKLYDLKGDDLLIERVYLTRDLKVVEEMIRECRSQVPPICFGLDDCSTEMLSRCPYRMDCAVDTDYTLAYNESLRK